MRPILFQLGPLAVPSYAFFVALAFVVGLRVRKAEARRLGHEQVPGYAWVPVGALLGAVLGAKLGMLLFEPWEDFRALMAQMLDLDFTGKTVVGALAGGYLGVELAKRRVGITQRTGDAFAVAMPLGMGLGRLGCFCHGCCSGIAWDGPWAVEIGGILRHPAQLYEAVFDLGLAALAWRWRDRGWPEGHLFRRVLMGYAAIRFGLEPLRDDFHVLLGPLSGVQVVCLLTIVGFTLAMARRETVRTPTR